VIVDQLVSDRVFLALAGDQQCAARADGDGYSGLAGSCHNDLESASPTAYRDDLYFDPDSFLQLSDMADDPDAPAGGLQLLEHRNRHRHIVAVQRGPTVTPRGGRACNYGLPRATS
jgi:hypothetical protein